MTELREHADYPSATHLFTVRVWQESSVAGTAEVRFHVRHVLSGESRLFRDGATFLQYLAMKLAEAEEGYGLP